MTTLAGKQHLHAPQFTRRFHSFDRDYLRQLASGDAAMEHHFSSYFGDLLLLKLRARIRSPQLVEDIRQETLLRVLKIVREGGVKHPERFGAFVNAVCNNVMKESIRDEIRHEYLPSESEPIDDRVDLQAPLINQQRRRQVESVLEQLSERDRELLRMVFLEEYSTREICRRFKVGRDYLRVLLHRAKMRFRSKHSERFTAVN
jgi:RNA polymerase sigma-70 factor, ECF subfamily